MLKKRVAVAQNVAKQLANAERINDLALVATAQLAISMIEGRLNLNAAAEVGQDAFDAVAATFAQQSTSRQKLVAAHQHLLEVKSRVGLDAVAIGGMGDKEVPQLTGALQLVERTAA
jgi:hypothetical protein